MGHTSCLRYPRFDSFIQVHEWQKVACEGNITAAALLSVFEHKHNSLIENREFDSLVRQALRAANIPGPPDFKFWFTFEDSELLKRVKITKAKETLYAAIALLEKKKFISTNPPHELTKFIKSGQRKWFRFQANNIQPIIDAYELKLNGAPKSVVPPVDSEPTEKKKKTKKAAGKMSPGEASAARGVFQDWQVVHESPRTIETDAKLQKVVDLLRLTVDGQPLDERRLYLAIRGILLIPHNTGDNPNGRWYNAFDLIFRDVEHFEKYEAAALDVGLTVDNFQNYTISKSDLNLRKIGTKKTTTDAPAVPQATERHAAKEIYTAVSTTIAQGVASALSKATILNAVAKQVGPGDWFDPKELSRMVRAETSRVAPVDQDTRKKIDAVITEIINFQK